MTVFQLKRSNTADKRPDPALLLSGELALNYDVATGGVYYTNDAGTLTKIGPAQLSATAPNSTPAGSAGNALGEFWYDTANSELNIWDGTQWVLVSAGQIPPAVFANGGSKVEALTSQATLAATLVSFNNEQVNYNLASLTYSNGIFTNTTALTRTYTIDFQLNISTFSGGNPPPYYIWFQKNSTAGFSAANAYGLNAYIFTSTQAFTASALSTSWTFTLAPGDTISCWASFNTSFVTAIGGTSAGVTSPNGTRANVSEIVTLGATTNQVGGFAEYAYSGSLITATGDNLFNWNSLVNSSSDFTLTYDGTNRKFVNNTPETRTYRFDAVLGGYRGGNTYGEWDAWFCKNNTGATPGNTNRYGQQVILNPLIPGSPYMASRTVSWVFELAPGDSITTWWYCDALFSINGGFDIPAGTFTNNQICKLRITEIEATQNLLFGGRYANTLSTPASIAANTATKIGWNGTGYNTIDSLTASDGQSVFTNTSGQPRTYLISSQTVYSSSPSSTATPVSTWLQIDSTTDDPTARYSYFTGQSGNATTFVRSFSQVVTLQANQSFSIWVNALNSGNVGGAGFGMTSGNSTRLSITDITVESSGYGTINGVVAGVGLSGGGFTGIVTLDLDPATSTVLGGVKEGTGVSIAPDGTISVTAGTVSWIPNNTAPTTANNGDFWLNTTNGPFALQQRVSGAWVANDTTGAIINNIISTAVGSVPSLTPYDVFFGLGGDAAYAASVPINDIIFATNYTVTSSFNKITNVVTFTFTNTTGNTDDGTLLTSFVVGEKYTFQMSGDNSVDWVITSADTTNTAPFPVTVTARIADQNEISSAVALLAAVSGATVTDYEITGLGKNIFNGTLSFDPAIRGVLAPNTSLTGSFLYWSAPSNPPGGPYFIPEWSLVSIADMIQAGTGIGITYDDRFGTYTITNTAAAASTPGGPTGAIQFNNAGVFGGEAEFVWDSVNNWVRVPAIYGAVDSLTIGATTSGGGAGGLLSLNGGNATANAGQTGGGVSIFAGGGGAGGTGGSVTIRAASTGGSTGNGGNISITGGTGQGATFTSGNVVIAPGSVATGATSGTVQISGISAASATATYTPTAATDLATKAYVDGSLVPVAWIPNDTAPTTANNGDFWLNTSTGPFSLEQRVGGAWVANDTTGAITNNIINTAAFDVPYPTLYDIIGISAGRGGFTTNAALNAYTDDTRYNITTSFNKITGVLTFTYSVTSGTLDYAGLTTGWVVDGLYDIYYTLASGDDTISYILTGYEQNAAGPNTIQFTARVLDASYLGFALRDFPQITGAVNTDYEITGLGKNVFNGVSAINPAFRGITTNNTSTTGSYLFLSAPSNSGGFYDPAEWKSVTMADMIQSGGTGIGITYNTLLGRFAISNTAPGPSYNVNTPLIPTVLATPGDGTFTNSGDSSGVYTLGLVIIFTGDPSYTRYTVTGSTYNPGDLTTTTSVTPNWSTSGFTPAANATTSSTTVAPIAFLNPGNNITFDYYTLQDAITINATTQTTPPAGANTQVQYNNNGAFGAEADFAYVAGTNTLTVGNITGTAANFALTVPTPATADTVGYNISVTAGAANGTANGGNLNLVSGPGDTGGNINITAADTTSVGGISGGVFITGGTSNNAVSEPGSVTITGSTFVNLPNGSGGAVNIYGGPIQGAGGTGGDVLIQAGNAATPGDMSLSAGSTTASGGTGGLITITGGASSAGLGSSGTGGSVQIQGGAGVLGGTNVTGGNVSIAGGAAFGTGTRGDVSITDITTASAKATYVPTAVTDLTTKSYVDGKFVPGGSTGQVQFNNAGVFGGDPEFVYDPVTNVLTIPNILSGNSTLDLVAGPQTAANNPGHDVSVIAGNANGNANGGNVILTGGQSGGLASRGGNITITGGNATGANNTPGGNVVISGGTGIGTGAAGSLLLSGISTATATATYTPTNGVDLTTKSYVDGLVAAPGTVTGAVAISNTTASTSKITGALTVAGGVGVSGDVYANTVHTDSLYSIGTAITAYNDILPNTASTRSLGSATLPWQEVYIQAGSIHFAAASPSVNPVAISNANNYLQLSGGGFKILDAAGTGTLYQIDPVTALVTSGAQTQVTNANNTTGVGTGSFQTAGGAYVAKDLIVTGSITANNLIVSTPNYATILSTATQTNTTTNTAHAVTYSTVDYGQGITISNSSRVNVSRAGVYYFVVSLQVQKSDSGSDDFDLWFGKNGTYLTNSTSHYTLVSQATSELIAVVNFVLPLAANDYIELFWSSADPNIFLLAQTGLTNPTRPNVPSVILTVTEVK